MFCPNCSRESLEKKNFCPSCGLKLQPIFQALTSEQSQKQEDVKTIDPVHLKQNNWQLPMLPGLFVILLGIIISLLGRDLFAMQGLTDIGAIVAIFGMGLVAYKGTGRPANESKIPRSLQTIPQTARLSPAMQAGELVSITEHTTRELALPSGSEAKSAHDFKG